MNRRQPPPPPGSERRQHIRFGLMAQVELSIGGEVSLLPVINVSAGGVLVDASGEHAPLGLGDAVKVFLSSYEGGPQFGIAGKVVRLDRRPDGVVSGLAVMWTSADDVAKAGLGKLLERLKK